jgi:hypothetical protein
VRVEELNHFGPKLFFFLGKLEIHSASPGTNAPFPNPPIAQEGESGVCAKG